MANEKYEITDIAHEQYPFLHRIRALRDIGEEVKAGDLGGFVESETNLSFGLGDDAWIFDDAIVAGDAVVDKNALLRDNATVCGQACVSCGSVMSGHSRAQDDVYLNGATMLDNATASGNAMILRERRLGGAPVLSGQCRVYGTVRGDIRVGGKAVLFSNQSVENVSKDTFILTEKGQDVMRRLSRDILQPVASEEEEKAETEREPEKPVRKRSEPQR